ncbi:MAG: CBS domain-containing protein, partial [Bacteroidales bacterium]
SLFSHDRDKEVLTLLKTSELIETDFVAIEFNKTLGDLVQVIAISKRNMFPVVDNCNRLQGIVYLDDIRRIMFDRKQYDTTYVYSLMKSAPAFIYADEKMDSVMHKFEYTNAWNLPVVDDENKYLGFVSKSNIFSSYREQIQQ